MNDVKYYKYYLLKRIPISSTPSGDVDIHEGYLLHALLNTTSFPVERLFSVPGQVDTDRRTSSSMTLLVFLD